jgi:hypothetical protein
MTQTKNVKSLYNHDILLWVEDTVSKLKARDFAGLDLENLIEEIEALGISQKKEMLSRLTTLLEHLLKRIYVLMPNEYSGWERTIRNQRTELDILLGQVPSLKVKWDEHFDRAWQLALIKVKKEYKTVSFPTHWLFARDLAAMLDLDFWE